MESAIIVGAYFKMICKEKHFAKAPNPKLKYLVLLGIKVSTRMTFEQIEQRQLSIMQSYLICEK